MKNKNIKTACRILMIFCGGNVTGIQPFYKKFLRNLFAENPDAVVYGVLNGFYGMTDPKSVFRITSETIDSFGSFYNCLQTCRSFNPAEHLEEIALTLKQFEITAVVGAGGDGTSRGIASFVKKAKDYGISTPWIFIPASIDGINHSSDTIGKNPAVKFIADGAKYLMMNAHSTLDCDTGMPRIAIVECPGRDRNDLMTAIISKLSDMEKSNSVFKERYIGIPFCSDRVQNIDSLYKIIDAVGKTECLCILVHEHSKICLSDGTVIPSGITPVAYSLAEAIRQRSGIKCNVFVPGHLAQTNSFIDEADIALAEGFADKASQLFSSESYENFVSGGESFAVIKHENEFRFAPLAEFAVANGADPNKV